MSISKTEELSDYLSLVRYNLDAPLEAYPAAIMEAEALLAHIVDCLNEPGNDIQSVKMLMFAHSAWRCGIFVAVSGASSHSTPVFRQSLEAAMYSFLFRFDPKFIEFWSNRETSKSAKDNFRKKWLPRTKELLAGVDIQLCERVDKLLDDLVSFGGHPNFLSVEQGIDFIDGDFPDQSKMRLTYLADHSQRLLAFILAANVAEMVAQLFEHVFPDRARYMGVQPRLNSLRKAVLVMHDEYYTELQANE